MKAGLSSGSDISEDGNDEDETASPQDLSVPPCPPGRSFH